MPELPSNDEQLRRIREFLSQLKQLLEAVVYQPHNILPGRHHDSIQDAWPDVSSAFDTIISSVTIDRQADLEAVGLQGFKLIFEIGVFDHARAELLDLAPELFSQRPLEPQPEKDAGFWAKVRRFFQSCLRAADVILGSLAKIPAFALGEVIKQFKEGVEAGVAIKDALTER